MMAAAIDPGTITRLSAAACLFASIPYVHANVVPDASFEDGAWSLGDGTMAIVTSPVRALASALQAKGWPRGSRVGLLSKNCAHWILADLAIWMSGHVTVPIFPTARPEAINYILRHAEVKPAAVSGPTPVSGAAAVVGAAR